MANRLAPLACRACKDGVDQPFPFTMAFQPIVDVEAQQVFAYEALVRGPRGESAGSILSQVTDANCYAFDQNCRVKAISLASQLGLAGTRAKLSINFMPGAIYSPAACIQLTLKSAETYNFPLDGLIFEITEAEKVLDRQHMRDIVAEYHRLGFKIALDDFGAGYCGMSLLADLPIDIVKLDIDLTRDLHRRPKALAIVNSMVELAKTTGCDIVAEGVETIDEFTAIRDCGIRLMQGYLLAKLAFEALPGFTMPEPAAPSDPLADACGDSLVESSTVSA
jgi:EAL domain-containing protein (putative c-di-GMP-specific phosphodiesterase class I)